MEPDDILARLDTPYASYQWEVMDAAVEQQSALTPLLLQRLESAAADPEALLDMEGPGLLYILALLAHFRETAAHEPLLRLASWPEDTIDALLGDAITELLPAVLWRTSAGETDGLRRLLEDRSAYGFCRGAAAEALAWGALFRDLDHEAIESYLLSLLDDETFAEHGDPAWYCVFHAVLDLYPQAHEDPTCANGYGPHVSLRTKRPRATSAGHCGSRANRPSPGSASRPPGGCQLMSTAISPAGRDSSRASGTTRIPVWTRSGASRGGRWARCPNRTRSIPTKPPSRRTWIAPRRSASASSRRKHERPIGSGNRRSRC